MYYTEYFAQSFHVCNRTQKGDYKIVCSEKKTLILKTYHVCLVAQLIAPLRDTKEKVSYVHICTV